MHFGSWALLTVMLASVSHSHCFGLFDRLLIFAQQCGGWSHINYEHLCQFQPNHVVGITTTTTYKCFFYSRASAWWHTTILIHQYFQKKNSSWRPIKVFVWIPKKYNLNLFIFQKLISILKLCLPHLTLHIRKPKHDCNLRMKEQMWYLNLRHTKEKIKYVNYPPMYFWLE